MQYWVAPLENRCRRRAVRFVVVYKILPLVWEIDMPIDTKPLLELVAQSRVVSKSGRDVGFIPIRLDPETITALCKELEQARKVVEAAKIAREVETILDDPNFGCAGAPRELVEKRYGELDDALTKYKETVDAN